MIRTITLNKLVPSPRNVRRRVDEQADRELKADILARGLLQNLVVTAAPKPRGSFAVEAGERRRRALLSLADEGAIARDHEVCCLVLDDRGAAQEASLAENFQRLAMNPADECLAFHRLLEEGADVEGIARRFGLTTRFVEGRLRLAALAPIVFEALGAGEISLDIAKAYAATPDQERQAQVFEQMSRGYGYPHPDSIRRMMTQATASGSDRRARLVGEEAYLAAGGRIERDLFSEEGSARWLDIAILERLACERMDALAAAAAAETGLGWVRPTLDSWVGGAQTAGLRPVRLESPVPSEEERALAESLEAEAEDLAAGLEDEALSEDERETAEARIRILGERIEALVDKPPVIDEALKPAIGTFLTLDEEGRPRLAATYYAESAGPAAESDGEEGCIPAEAPAARSGGLSQRLVDELAMQRRDVLAVHVASAPAFALDLAIFLMIDRQETHASEKSGSSLVAARPSNPVLDFRTPEAAATIAAAEAAAALDRNWTEGKTRAARFDAFRTLPEDARAAWLGHAVARTLEASLNLPGDRACAFHDHLGRLLGIEVASWWRPTGLNYFDRVPKAMTLAALGEVGGPALSERYAKAKKAELAQACERIFAGDFIAEVEVKEAALAWLPEAMRFAPPPPDASEGAPQGAGEEPDLSPTGDETEIAPERVEEAA
ncbi:MAG TPA: ParB/RepB/Spo0J family partition protein [Allosphingosinicella sp.]|jgi:ParB family chromosome partitioning protein|nr:ParB/RepB/Spo0J family partition protein [Allosphingosinicella sp.]